MWVAHTHRSAGLGRALVDAVLCGRVRARAIYSARNVHERLRDQVYESLGFTMTGRTKPSERSRGIEYEMSSSDD